MQSCSSHGCPVGYGTTDRHREIKGSDYREIKCSDCEQPEDISTVEVNILHTYQGVSKCSFKTLCC